jgi:Domain of unknown function (DUF2828)
MKMRNTFVNAVKNQSARTENGMKARESTADSLTDLFYNIGAMRGKDVIPSFAAARAVEPVLANRVALWARDVRQGAGERKIFRDILKYLAKTDPDSAVAMMRKVPELGRWDDLFAFVGTELQNEALNMICSALDNCDGLCAKWMPRKGPNAVLLREAFGWSPKFYRKTLVNLTNVVESDMCSGNWDSINFNHVPSLASSRYKKAFSRHTENYKKWTEALVSKDPKVKATVKVNAGAVYPYDVLKGVFGTYSLNFNRANLDHILAQWEALPNYVGDGKILPLVDVSGSMTSQVSPGLSALTVAVSLGLYLADKNQGKFKDTFLTFSNRPELLHLQGNILEKIDQMVRSKWEMNTNLHAAMEKILSVAIQGRVPQEEMPDSLLILSDMQFDACTSFDHSAMEMIRHKFENAGYKVLNIVFWNLNSRDNVPAKYDERGVALVSGFSPTIVKSVLAADLEEFSPRGIMMKTIMNARYDY